MHFIYHSRYVFLSQLFLTDGRTEWRTHAARSNITAPYKMILCASSPRYMWEVLSSVKRICVFEHSVMINFNCACPHSERPGICCLYEWAAEVLARLRANTWTSLIVLSSYIISTLKSISFAAFPQTDFRFKVRVDLQPVYLHWVLQHQCATGNS